MFQRKRKHEILKGTSLESLICNGAYLGLNVGRSTSEPRRRHDRDDTVEDEREERQREPVLNL